MLYMKEHKLLVFFALGVFLYNKIKIKKDKWKEICFYRRKGVPALSGSHNIYWRSVCCSWAEEKGEERQDDTSFVCESNTPPSLWNKDNWQNHLVLPSAAILEEQTPSKCFYSVLLAAGWLTLSPLGTHISRISPFVLCWWNTPL